MKRILTSLLAFGLLVVPGVVAPISNGQEGQPSLATWQIEIWPEYDQPAVLIIATGAFADPASLPQEATVPVPAGADIHAVAYGDASGGLFDLPWELQETATGPAVRFTPPTPNFRIEYYLDIIAPPPNRRFDLSLPVPYPVNAPGVTLRQPDRASGLETEPPMAPAGVDARGAALFRLEPGPLSAGSAIDLAVSYTKADALPSVALQAPIAEEDVQARPTWQFLLIGLLVGLVLLAMAFAIYQLVRVRRRQPVSRQARRRQERQAGQPARQARPGNRPVREGAAAPPTAMDKFCPQCGASYRPDDRFCRVCGTARR